MTQKRRKGLQRLWAMLLVIVLVISGISFPGMHSRAETVQLVKNGDFEEVVKDDDGNVGLSGWVAKNVNQSNGSFKQGKKDGYDGSYAKLETDGSYGMDTDAKAYIRVESNTTYTFSYWGKLTGDTPILSVYAYFYNQAGGASTIPYTILDATIDGASDWKQYKTTFTTPNDAEKVGLSFVLSAQSEDGKDAIACIDVVEVNKTDKSQYVLTAEDVKSDNKTAYSSLESILYNAMRNSTAPLFGWGFTDDEMSGWNLGDATKATVSDAPVEVVNKCLRTELGAYVQSPTIEVEAGETYTVKAKMHCPTEAQAVIWSQQLNGSGQEVGGYTWQPGQGYVSSIGQSTNGWADVEFDVKMSEQTAKYRLDFQFNGGSGVTYLDDITITKKSATEIFSCGFEDGEMSGWNLGDTTKATVSDAPVEVVNKCLRTELGAYVQSPTIEVEAGETYTVKAKMHCPTEAQAVIWSQQLNGSGQEVGGYTWQPGQGYVSSIGQSTNGWADVEFDVKMSEQTAKYRLDFQFNEGSGVTYWDDITITKKAPTEIIDDGNLVKNGSFEKGNSNWTITGSEHAVKQVVDSGNDDHGKVMQMMLSTEAMEQDAPAQVYMWSDEMAVKPNYIYTVSYQVKVTPDDNKDLPDYGAITLIQEVNSNGVYTGTAQASDAVNRTDDWKTITYEYRTGADATKIRIDLMFANMAGTALWDNVSIKEKEPYTPTVLDQKYDHGGTADTRNEANVITNSTFDNGNISGWMPQEGVGAYATSNQNGGVLRFQVSPGRYFQSNAFKVQGSSIYKLTYYVKVEDAKNLDFFPYLFYNESDNWTDMLSYSIKASTNDKWKEVTISFATPTLDENGTCTIGFKSHHTEKCKWQKTNKAEDCDCTSEGTIYLDDISMIRTGAYEDKGDAKTSEDSLIYNGTFDRFAMNPQTVDGWDLNVTNKNFTATIQNQVARSGNAIKMVAKGHSYIWAQDFSVKPGTIYILSYWVRVDSAKGLKFAPYMNDANYNGHWWLDDAAQPVYEKTKGWVKIASAVSVPESLGQNKNNPEHKVQLGFQIYEGAGTIYLDDVSFVPTKVKATDKNLDFELDKTVLYNWSFASYNGGNGSATTSTQTRPGSKGKVSAVVTNKGASGNSIFTGSKIKVKPNTTYQFTYWTKQTGDYQGISTQFFHQLKKDGVTEAMSPTFDGNKMQIVQSASISPYWTYQVQGQVGWRQVSLSFTTGKDTHYVEPRFLLMGGNVKTWFDDVTLTKVKQNPNLDFENTSKITGAPENWYMSMARSLNVKFESDSSLYHSGRKSLHVVKDSLHEKVTIDNAALFKVNKDSIYEFSFWVNSRNCAPDATIRMDLQLYRKDGTRIYQTDGNYQLLYGTVKSLNGGKKLSGWQKVTTRSAIPTEAAYATINFVVSRGHAEFWIDDIFCNIVENETDCVVYYEDFHAVDQNGNISDWKTAGASSKTSFVSSGGGKFTIKSGEAYIKNRMKMLMTDYTYTIKGNYSANTDMNLELRFYDYMGREYTDERQSTHLSAKAKKFEMTVTVPSNSYAAFYIGGKNAGTITVKNITVYMVAKPADSSDWAGRWVWYPEDPVKDAVKQYRYFRYEFVLEDEAEYAPLQMTVDDKYAFYLNGKLIDENWDAGNDSWANVASYDLTGKVKKGRNVIALKCYNLVSEAGVLFDGKFTLKNQNVAVVASGTDVVSTKKANDKSLDWTKVGYNDSSWKACREYGQPPCSPWGPVYYNSTLYIHNAATVVSTKVPEKVIAGKTLDFEVTFKLDAPIESKFSPLVTIYKRNSTTSITAAPMVLKDHENPLEWPVGEEFTVQCSIDVPDYVESGKYQLQMNAKTLLLDGEEVYDNKFVSFAVQASGTGRDPIVSKIENVNGTPTLTIDGEPQAAHFYNRPDLNVYLQTDAETRLYQSDLELYITYGGSLYKGGCDPIWLEDGSIDYDVFDGVIYDTLGSNSNAYAMVNIGMFAPNWWMEQNPDQVGQSMDSAGNLIQADDVSFASEKFRKEAGEVLRKLLQHMKEQSYYNRIYGIKITGGHTYEWMTWGTGEGYGPDYSAVSKRGFRKYLKKKYKTVAALRKAWGMSGVTFENAASPTWSARKASNNVYMGSVSQGKFPRNMVDWNLYLNEASADSFLYYCQIAKEETDNNLIVGGYNGYLWTNNSYDAQGKAHTAFYRVLQSEYVDWVASPVAYTERTMGESNVYMTLIDAVQEYGKMYIAEEDNRTCLSSVYAGASWDANWDFQVGQTRTLADTVLQAKRDFANAMVNGVGLWQYDMYGGWLDDDQIYEYLSDAKAEYDFSVYVDRDQRNEVAVFVGDESYAYMTAGTMSGYASNEPMLLEQRKHLSAMGAGYDTYNMNALLDGKVSSHKVNIILSPTEITEEMQKAIDRYLKVNDQYIVWVYLPGISTGSTYSLENVRRTTGFSIGIEEKVAGQQVQVDQTGSALTKGLKNLVYGGSQPSLVSPLAYIKDTAGATVLGHNMDGGKAGLAVKDMGDWTSIYSTATCLDYRLLRNILKTAGVHIYSENADDVIYNNNHYVALHSGTSGKKTIKLPETHSVYDVFKGEFLSMETDTITYYHDADDTHIFRLLTPNTYAVTARLKSGKGTLSMPGLTEVKVGGSYELTVTPEKGYEISEVIINDEKVELDHNTFHVDDIDQNYVIEVRFSKLPELVEVVETIQELIILPWWAFVTGLVVVIALILGTKRLMREWKRKREQEEEGTR